MCPSCPKSMRHSRVDCAIFVFICEALLPGSVSEMPHAAFTELDQSEKLSQASCLLLERLPDENYEVLKYIVEFLAKVIDRSDLNKMTSSNLAIVFGPNLLWSRREQASLNSITHINQFAEYIFRHHHLLFSK